MTSPKPSESTPATVGSSRNLREPASTERDGRTPEERLLARRRLGSAYLEDVRAIIDRAEQAEAMLAEFLTGNARYVTVQSSGEFGTIRTTILPDE